MPVTVVSQVSRDIRDKSSHPRTLGTPWQRIQGDSIRARVWHRCCKCIGMNVRESNTNRTWAGLLIEAPGQPTEEKNLREILGGDAVVLVMRGTDAAIDSVRSIVRSKSSCILTVMNAGIAPSLVPLLNIASSLASLRRIVVLHDSSVEPNEAVLRRGVLMLRDCPEVRSALTALIARELPPGHQGPALHGAGESASMRFHTEARNAESPDTLAFEACVRVEDRTASKTCEPKPEQIRPIGIEIPPFRLRSVSA